MQTTFIESASSVEITLVLNLPKQEKNCDLKEVRKEEVIEAFKEIIKESLTRRMNACQALLMSHINEVFHNDGKQIMWKRGDGSVGIFNIPSFETMQGIINNFSHGDYRLNQYEADQILKAIANDTEKVSHEDRKGFRFSQLISILCEIHMDVR